MLIIITGTRPIPEWPLVNLTDLVVFARKRR
jgi:hypothetical protein